MAKKDCDSENSPEQIIEIIDGPANFLDVFFIMYEEALLQHEKETGQIDKFRRNKLKKSKKELNCKDRIIKSTLKYGR